MNPYGEIVNEEITLLEKQKTKILDEISRLQKAKADQYFQYSTEIEPLKEQKNSLIYNLDLLNKKLNELRAANEKEIKGAQEFANKIVRDAENRAATLKAEAELILNRNILKKEELDKLIVETKLKEDRYNKLENELELATVSLAKAEEIFGQQKRELMEKSRQLIEYMKTLLGTDK